MAPLFALSFLSCSKDDGEKINYDLDIPEGIVEIDGTAYDVASATHILAEFEAFVIMLDDGSELRFSVYSGLVEGKAYKIGPGKSVMGYFWWPDGTNTGVVSGWIYVLEKNDFITFTFSGVLGTHENIQGKLSVSLIHDPI